MSFLLESGVEEVCLRLLADLGYETADGGELVPDADGAERPDYATVVLRRRLDGALARLNPELPLEALEQAARELTSVVLPSLVGENERLHRLVTEGVDVEYRAGDGQTRSTLARVIDINAPEANDWLAASQVTVEHDRRRRRADVIMFLNGLPVAVFELKNPGDEDATVKGAWRQLRVYTDEVPQLFRHNALLVASDGTSAQMGTITASWEHMAPWRTIDGDVEADAATPELEVLVRGVFDRGRFLDLLANFTVFSDEGDGLAKRVARYHQYWAVNEAVDSTVQAATDGDRRAGVVWHTQGSGKSLEMLFYAAKIMRHPAMANPTLVVLTDRNDLDDQLFDEVFAPAHLLPEAPVQAQSRIDLRGKLARPSGGIVFTTLQKFAVAEQGDRHPELTDRSNVVVLADEAHRSQYDFIDGFARHLRDALPNASFIGFTGTPIEAEDRSTRQVFGDYIHVYDITRSVEDGATVPLYYESRLAKIALPDDVDVDERFAEVTETREDDEREKLKGRWARLEAIVGSAERVRTVAADIVAHWEARREAMAGKAMIVGMSRRICVALYDEIIALRPDWHADDDERGKIKVVMTGQASDPADWQRHIRPKDAQRRLKTRAKDPDDELELVIVRDMWLTGFDSPPMHTMYVDKPMKGHTLMQAIARVNRSWRDKPAGLIVDYLGIADNLREALASYSARDQQHAGVPIEQAAAKLVEKHEVVVGILHGQAWTERARSSDAQQRIDQLKATADYLAADPDRKRRFLDETLALVKAYSLAVPHEATDRLRDDVAFFQAVRSNLAKTAASGADGRPSDEELDTAINQLLSETITAEGVVDIYAQAGIAKPNLSVLSEEFLDQLQHQPHKNLQMEALKKLLNDEVRSMRRSNVVQYRRFSEMLEQAIRGYQNRALSTAEVIAELVELAKEMQAAQHRGDDLGLSDDEVAFYDAVRQNDSAVLELGDDVLREIAGELVRLLKRQVTVDWNKKEAVRARIRTQVRRLLRRYKYPPDKQEAAIELVLEQTHILADQWSEAA